MSNIVNKFRGADRASIGKLYGIDSANIAKYIGVDWTIPIPVGLILPLRGGAAVPTGWDIFTLADGKMIIGAGSTYNPGDNGAGNGNIDLSHTASGDHLPATAKFGDVSHFVGTTTSGTHQHTTMIFTNPMPNNQQHRLIKANTLTGSLAQDIMILKAASGGWPSFTRLVPGSNRLFMANTADGTGGKTSGSVLSSSNGAHTHGTAAGITPAGQDSSAWENITQVGAHTHTFTANLLFNMFRVQMSAWYSAAGAISLSGVNNFIGMWESLTPPQGWSLCDGTGGTPDLRDFFWELPTTDIGGASLGNGRVTSSNVTNSAGAHHHIEDDCNDCDNEQASHAVVGGAHTHTVTENSLWLPPYYSLAFIQFTG